MDKFVGYSAKDGLVVFEHSDLNGACDWCDIHDRVCLGYKARFVQNLVPWLISNFPG